MKEKNKEEKIDENVDVKEVIKSLVDLDWEKNQGKVAQLLKGLAHSDDPESDKFMAKLSAAATKIGTNMDESKMENTILKDITERANDFMI